MSESVLVPNVQHPVSEMAESLIGSEIIKLAAEINEKIRQGERIYNYTIGDFDPKVFPIPNELNSAIIKAYEDHHTNYPAANGMADLRLSVAEFEGRARSGRSEWTRLLHRRTARKISPRRRLQTRPRRAPARGEHLSGGGNVRGFADRVRARDAARFDPRRFRRVVVFKAGFAAHRGDRARRRKHHRAPSRPAPASFRIER